MAKAEMTRVVHTPIRGKARVQKAQNPKSGDIFWVVSMTTSGDKDKDAVVEIPKFKVAATQAPAYLKPGLDWQLTVTSDKSKILAGVPDTMLAVARFKEFVHAKDQPPAPKVQPSRFKPDEAWATFMVVYEVIEGEFAGVEVVDFLNYNFTYIEKPTSKGPTRLLALEGNGKSTDALAARLEALGILEFGPIKWEGPVVEYAGSKTKWVNVLPKLAQRARKAADELDRKVLINVAGGKIVTIKAVLPEDVAWEDEDESTDVVADAAGTESQTDTDADDEVEIEADPVDAPEGETLPDDDEINWSDEDETE